VVHDPVLQFHSFALQTKQLLEVDATIERLRLGMLGDLGQQLGQAIVVDLISSSSSMVSSISPLMRSDRAFGSLVMDRDPGFGIGFDLLHSMPMTMV